MAPVLPHGEVLIVFNSFLAKFWSVATLGVAFSVTLIFFFGWLICSFLQQPAATCILYYDKP